MYEELGIIRGPHIGLRDVGAPCLWFTVEIVSGAALQVMNWEEAGNLIRESELYDFTKLDGHACIVEVERNMITFKRLKKGGY